MSLKTSNAKSSSAILEQLGGDLADRIGLGNVQDLGSLALAGIRLEQWTTLLDIFLVALILYSVYVVIRETRAIRILYGILLLGLFYVLGRALNLAALNFVLQSVVTVTLVAIPVVFQPELRSALERLGRGELLSSVFSRSKERIDHVVTELTRALPLLSDQRIGALIVLERQSGLKDLAATGVTVDGILTSELLATVFTPKTPLHDGAILVRGRRIVAAAVFLPLTSTAVDVRYGTRHRAAIGLSEESDAVVLVVSEETGRISLVVHGKIEVLEPAKIERRLRALLVAGQRG